jgi:pimeloyl-ACP methyl ester carboxylesterase
VKLLQCKHSERPSVVRPVATSGKDGVEVVGEGHMSLAYALMDQAARPWTFWDYDWRLDMRFSGQRLHRFLLTQATSGDRWHVVCHSQGGLVLLWAAKALGAEAFASLVRSVVFVGVPFFGTFSALGALVDGTFIAKSIPKQLARTWPSIYQMLPRWNSKDRTKRDADLLLNSSWSAAGLFPPDVANVDAKRHVDPVSLARARAWNGTMNTNQFEALRKLDFVRIVQGQGLGTLVEAPNFPSLAGALEVDGDGLVPDVLTRDLLPDWVRDRASILRMPAGQHSLLCSDSNVYDWCV